MNQCQEMGSPVSPGGEKKQTRQPLKRNLYSFSQTSYSAK